MVDTAKAYSIENATDELLNMYRRVMNKNS